MVEEVTLENPNSLVVGENSRWRADSNLSELMEGIKQVGVLQPIVARKEDKMVICGNRRLAATIKLGLDKVPVRWLRNISDKQLLILNLQENLQRKDISPIEIGRLCDKMLKDSSFNLTLGELAVELGMAQSRIKTCLEVFRRLPSEFRGKVVHLTNSMNRKYGDLPEQVVFAVLNFSQMYRRINEEEIRYFLQYVAENKITVSQIRIIGLLYLRGLPFRKAIKQIDNYRIVRLDLVALKTELGEVINKEKISNQNELFSKIIKEKYPNLLF